MGYSVRQRISERRKTARGLPRQTLAGKPLAAFAFMAVVFTLPAGSNGALTAHAEFVAATVDRSPSLPPGVLHGVAGRSEHPYFASALAKHSRPRGQPSDIPWHNV